MKIFAGTGNFFSLRLFLALIFMGGFWFFGCSRPLRTLMDVNAEQKSQQNFVRRQDLKFDLLLNDIKRGRLEKGTRLEFVQARYGEPVLIKDVKGGRGLLYRRPLDYLNAPKVYLDFDENGILVNTRIVEDKVGH